MERRTGRQERTDESVVIRDITVENELGLHARPAAMLVKLANTFVSQIYLEKDGEQVNGKSIMGVMMLAASKGSRVKLIAKGDDALSAIEALVNLFIGKFGEN